MSWPLAESRDQAVRCLTDAIVYEAATEPLAGQQAVAQVIMNRTRSGTFPANVCGVVYQGSERHTGCQFTFTCDGSMRRRTPSSSFFDTARPIAEAAFDGTLPDRVGKALFYHANYVMPRWAPLLDRVTQIGAHIFYQRPGGPPDSRPDMPAMAMARPVTPPPAAGPFAPWGISVPRTTGGARQAN
jgi:spore germination cell wall hydrolase CwlJ-like protein